MKTEEKFSENPIEEAEFIDNEIDFEYKGERLANDILKGYVFEDEEEQIPLKVIEPKK